MVRTESVSPTGADYLKQLLQRKTEERNATSLPNEEFFVRSTSASPSIVIWRPISTGGLAYQS